MNADVDSPTNSARRPAPPAQRDARSAWRRYGFALLLIAAAIPLRYALASEIGHVSVVVFLAAILAGAWLGGVGPALLCTFTLHVVHGFWFTEPRGLWESNTASIVSIVAYYLIGIVVGLLSQMRAAARRRELDQQQEAVSQREHFRATLACMAEAVLVTDVDGRITLMNPVAEQMTGWNLSDAQGNPWRDVISIRRDDRRETERPIDRVLVESRVVHERTPMLLASRAGRSTPITYSAAPVRNADSLITGAVLIFRDESERQRTELALRNADRRKDEFLATLAHELRNPLSPIAAGLELLQASGDDPNAAEELRAMMQRQTQHMVRLIDDLLDVSRITRGKLELRNSQVDLRDIVRNAVEATRSLIEQSEHQFTARLPEESLLLYADANRLTQVLTNLLNNAAKYTPRGGRIELEVQHEGGEFVLELSDSGIGIPADKLDGVFEMFAQIHESSEYGHSGLGIGLALVKRLVEMHGGSIEAHSRGRNLGSTFHVRLPALPQPKSALEGAPPMNGEFSRAVKRRILVVDDNADALDALSRLVSAMGNDVEKAHDGAEAIEMARTFRPDVILMDLGMPKLNGYHAAQRIRQEPWGREIALVATTGWGQDEDRRRTAEAGFDRHLVKPITIQSLRDVLENSGSPSF
jgi:PAS domain S-box-containing protein